MAVATGRSGSVAVGANVVAEVRSFSIEENATTTETTSMSTTGLDDTYVVTKTSSSGTLDVLYDYEDTTGQGALQNGSSVTLNLYPTGNSSSQEKLTGTALVTSRTVNESYDGMVEMSLGVTITGGLATSSI